ncbi:MAG: glycerol kinase GlpK [Candidatus Omnitrophica bacterium]|nr:glycerol kinase GlpK [Candidatus Omnitrophota bacterium]
MSQSKQYILAIDQGTTGSRALVVDSRGKTKGAGYVEIPQHYPKPGWVEHSPQDILHSVRTAITQAIRKSRISSNEIRAIGITNQRESTVLWNRKTGKPYHPVIVWQDRRTSGICEGLKKRGLEPLIREKTGLVLDPYFSGSKILWLMKQLPKLAQDAKRGQVAFGTMDTWLLWNMTGEHATDVTNASRTLLYNIQTREWDQRLCRIFSAHPSMLPRVQVSASHFGNTKKWHILPDGIPVMAMAGDQQAALYGQACYGRGEMKNTYGTGCFLMMNTGSVRVHSQQGLLTTLACDAFGKPVYAIEGAVFIGGALIQWLRDSMRWIRSAGESEQIAKSVSDSHGVTVIPAFTGLGAPYWNAEARGAILGLTRGVTSAHIVRASLESVALQVSDLVLAVKKELRFPIRFLKVDGGASNNNFLMQFQSDILGLRILRSHLTESTAWGIGKMAGVSLGIWKGPYVLDHLIRYQTFRPGLSRAKRKQMLHHWRRQIQRVLGP